MNFNGFDLNLLVALDALLSERNVTRAAQRLHITQPAMSNALQRLRQRLDDPILERSGRELKLTPVAEELVRPLQELLSHAEQLIGLTEGFDPLSATRTFRIAMSDYCAMVYLPVVVETLARVAPHVRCDAEPLNELSFDRLCSRNLDFYISAQDVFLMGNSADSAKVHRSDLFSDKFVSATSEDHPAVRRGLDLDTYLRSPYVSYRSGVGVRALEEQSKSTLGLDVSIGAVTSTIGAMPLILRGTDLIATYPSRLTAILNAVPRFHVHPCPIDIPDLVETLFWHPMSETDHGHQWMKETLIAAGSSLANGG